MAIEVIDIEDIAERDKEKRRKEEEEGNQRPFAPPPEAPGEIPYWDPEEEDRYRREREEDKKGPERGAAVVVDYKLKK